MEVTIIGAGNMGRGIGTRLAAGGHDLKIIDNDSDEAAKLAGELASAGDGSAEGAAAGDPLSGVVVILAVWFPGSLDAVERYEDQLDGKVVVDISNPVDTETFDGLTTPRTAPPPRRWRGRHPKAPRS